MIAPLASAAFMAAGLIAALAGIDTLRSSWPRIRRALRMKQSGDRAL